jgi:hypothetical protein
MATAPQREPQPVIGTECPKCHAMKAALAYQTLWQRVYFCPACELCGIPKCRISPPPSHSESTPA